MFEEYGFAVLVDHVESLVGIEFVIEVAHDDGPVESWVWSFVKSDH